MDPSSEDIREVEFREKLRGYHPDDVDAFVERVATTVEQLEQRLSELEAVRARASADAVTEETLRRTLIMAQRTADMVTEEANAAAERVLADAQQEADTMLAQANDTVQRSIDEAQRRIETDLAELEEKRRLLQAEAAALQSYVVQQRAALREVLLEQLQLLEEGEHAPPDSPPGLHDVLRLRAAGVPAPTTQWGPPGDAAQPRSTALPKPQPLQELLVAGTAAEQGGDLAARTHDATPAVAVPNPPASIVPSSAPAAFVSPDAQWKAPTGDADVLVRGRQIDTLLPGPGEEDPFLAELRRAVDDRGSSQPEGGPTDPSPAPDLPAPDEAVQPEALPEGGRASGRLFRRH